MRVANSGSFKKGERRSPETEFTREKMLGANNHKWKGDRVGYDALHTWVKRTLGKKHVCSDCGATNNLDWANVSKKYLRVHSDWIVLCKSCHDGFDGIAKLTRDQSAEVRAQYRAGVRQGVLAKQFGVHQSQISRIVNHKVIFYG